MSFDIDKLEPCPFCGGAMQFRKALWPSDGDTDAIIHSERSECGMRDFSTDTNDESVIAAWNTRAATQPAPIPAQTGIKTWQKRIDEDRNFIGVRSKEHMFDYVLDENTDLRAALVTSEASVSAYQQREYERLESERSTSVRAGNALTEAPVCPTCPKDTPYGPATCFNCVKDVEASAGNAVTDELQVVHKFLLGEGPLEGVWFGDRHPERNGTSYWWRKNLSAAIASHIKAGQAGKEQG